MTVLDVRRDGPVLWLTLNRPEHGNRLDAELLDALTEQFVAVADAGGPDAVAEAGGPDVVVLAAHGPDFCLGREPSGAAVTPANLTAEFGRIQRLNELVVSSPAVTVSVLTGRAFGAGLSLAARCDLVVAADDAVLSFPEIPHGIPPTIVLSHYAYVLQRVHLLDLILTGREVDALDGQRMGLVSRVAAASALDAEVATLVATLVEHDPRTVRVVKDFIRSLDGISPRQAPKHGISVYVNEMVERALADGGSRE